MVIPEEQQEAVNAEVPKLKRQINTLKKQLRELNERLVTQELSDFQLQIVNIDKRIDSFSNEFRNKMEQYEHELLGLECYVAAAKINEHVDMFIDLIDNSKLRDKINIRTQLIADAASIKTEIFSSKHRSHPSGLAVDFYQKWATYLRDRKISFVNM